MPKIYNGSGAAQSSAQKKNALILSGAALAIIIPILYSLLSGVMSSRHDLEFNDKEKLAQSIRECDDERIFLMTKGFMMSKPSGATRRLKATVQFVERSGDAMVWPGTYLLEKKRIHVKPKDFSSLGYNVYYDKAAQIVLMRYQNDPACLVFSCREAGSTRVAAYWSRNPATFDVWWREWTLGQVVTGKPWVHAFWASCPACLDPNDPERLIRVPLRVLAGAVRAIPDTEEVLFHPGGETAEPAKNSTVIIRVPGRLDRLRKVTGSYNTNWSVPTYLAARFNVH